MKKIDINLLIRYLSEAKEQGVKMVNVEGTVWVEPEPSHSQIIVSTENQM